MVASTDIKFFTHSGAGAPQITGTQGALLPVLDACLVDGISLGAITSAVATGTQITVTFPATHNLMQYQVIELVGAAQPEYNGEHKILTVPTASSITFQVATAPSVGTATGTITAKLSSLGWDKAFSREGARAYRSGNELLSSRPYLRVVDEADPNYNATYAKYAKVAMIETMTDIDDLTGLQAPFDAGSPSKNWDSTGTGAAIYNGWAKWFYARNGDSNANNSDAQAHNSGNREYLIVGTSDYFYLFVTVNGGTFNANTKPAVPYGFGAFKPYFADDNSAQFLASTLNYTKASDSYQEAQFSGGHIRSGNTSTVIQRGISKAAAYVSNVTTVCTPGVFTSGSGNIHTDSENILFMPLIANETSVLNSGTVIKCTRGEFINIYGLLRQMPFDDLQIFASGNSMYIAKTVALSATGQVVLKVGEV